MNIRYLVACTFTSIALFSSPSFSKEETLEFIMNNDNSNCYQAFNIEGKIPSYMCNMCNDYIKTEAKPEDKGYLLAQLSEKKCETLSEPFPEKDETGRSFYIDQDFLALDFLTDFDEDRNYTMGMGMSYSGKNHSKGILPDARNWLDKKVSFFKQSSPVLEYIHSFDFGITGFTPNDLEDIDPIPVDRPFASLIYFSSSKFAAYTSNYALKSKFTIGLLGLDVAKGIQRFLHNDAGLSHNDPLGWHNQISDGGELTALYSLEKITMWKEKRVTEGTDWDISYSMAANAGYYTDMSVGTDIRIGRITSPYYAHSSNPLSVYNHGNCASCNGDDNFFFFSYRVRLVAYNVLLQGQFRDSTHEFSDSEIERLLHEAGIGWTYHFSKKLQVTYSLNYKSEEYKGTESRAHWFGGLYFSVNKF